MKRFFWPLMILAIGLLHLLFHARYFHSWDGVQFALALEDFDVLNHRPHPPGYILLVALGHLFHFVFTDVNQAYLTINLICQILSTFLVFLLGRNLFEERIGYAAACLYAFSPIALFNANITCAYGAEGLVALSIAWSVERSLRLRTARSLCLATVLFAVGGGVRQNLLALLFPLWGYSFFSAFVRKDISFKIFFGLGFISSVLVASWMVPLLVFSGGIANYRKATSDLLTFLFYKTSVFYGISVFKFFDALGRLTGWIFILGLGLGAIPLFVYTWRERKCLIDKSFWLKQRSLFFALWILPSALFYLLFHLPKPGYILTFLGAFCILTALALNQILPRFQLRVKTAFISIFLLAQFLLPVHLNAEKSGLPSILFGIVNGLGAKYSRDAIQRFDRYFSSLFTYIEDNFDPQDTVIISESWPVAYYPIRRWLRHVMYYLPQYHFYEISSPPPPNEQSVFHAFERKSMGKAFHEHEYDGMLIATPEGENDQEEIGHNEQIFEIEQENLVFITGVEIEKLEKDGWRKNKIGERQILYSTQLKLGESISWGRVVFFRKLMKESHSDKH